MGLSRSLPFYRTSSSVVIPRVKEQDLERRSRHPAETIRSTFLRNASLKTCKLPFARHKSAAPTFHSAVTAVSSGTYHPEYMYALVCAHSHTHVCVLPMEGGFKSEQAVSQERKGQEVGTAAELQQGVSLSPSLCVLHKRLLCGRHWDGRCGYKCEKPRAAPAFKRHREQMRTRPKR